MSHSTSKILDLFSLDAYQYTLPEELIAQSPVVPRDSARLLVVNRTQGTFKHCKVSNLPEILDSNDLLVVNNTKVFKARLSGHRLFEEKEKKNNGGKIEFLMLDQIKPKIWEGTLRASAKQKPGVRFLIHTPDGMGLRGTVVRGASESPYGTVWVEFDRDPLECGAGCIPLPPYIRRESLPEDEKQYQTLYAKHQGSAAAPTAGLHFTDHLISSLKNRGVGWAEVTLHVGIGTFRPVKAPDIRSHKMHEERYEISECVAREIQEAKEQGRRVVAVGTTSVRTLESAWSAELSDGQAGRRSGTTRLFLHPGDASFKVVDRLFTNFHLPGSTLLMLACAFGGRDLILSAYEEAIRSRYRFFSYGDAMLIL